MAINSSTSPAIFRWRPAAWLRVSGADAFTFLQGQFTQDLRLLDQAPAVYGLWLTVKGKVLADSFILRRGQGSAAVFWVGSYFSSAAVIRERLEAYVIADDVVIEDLSDAWAGVCFVGSRMDDVAARLGAGADAFIFPGRRGVEATEYIHPVGEREPTAGAAEDAVSEERMRQIRIAAGQPAVPDDVGPGDLPNEAGLETTALSYTKGCYLGQEVMARLKSLGQVRRRLVRVSGTGERPAPGTVLFNGSRAVGEMRSSVAEADQWIGLAMITRMHVSGDVPLSAAPEGSPTVRLQEIP